MDSEKTITFSPKNIIKINGIYQDEYPVKLTIEFPENIDCNKFTFSDIRFEKKENKIIKPLPSFEERSKIIEIAKNELKCSYNDIDFLLVEACEQDNRNIINLLLEGGADISCVVKSNPLINTPIEKLNYELIEFLIEKGFEFKYKAELNLFMILLCKMKDVKIVNIMLPVVKKFSNTENIDIPLFLHLENETEEFLFHILKYYNMSSEEIKYCLFSEACAYNKFSLIRIMVEKYDYKFKGCFCNLKGKFKKSFNCETPLSIACSSKNIDIVRYVLQQNPIMYFPHNTTMSIFDNHTNLTCKLDYDIIKILAEYRADINFENSCGEKRILRDIIDCRYDSIDLVKFLVSKGAEITDGAISVSFNREYNKVVRWFFITECGIDINKTLNYNNETLLIKAAKIHDIKLVKYLLDKNADIHMKNNYGNVFSDYLTEKEKLELGPLIYPGSKIKKVKTEEVI